MNIKPGVSIAVMLIAVAATAGCASTFSKQALDQVDRDLSFSELQRDPVRHQGKSILVGGVIINARNTKEGSFIEVLQKPVDRQGRPRETDDTQGRFLITSPEFLDAAVYGTGKRISVIGAVTGQKVQKLGEMEYRYPVITAMEIRLWEPRTGPGFSIGIGIGVFHRF